MSEATPALLIVDDHEPNQRLYRAVLKDLGADILIAASGEQALLQAAQREFAMVLLDVHLNGISGFDVALRLREADPPVNAPIVFVSAVYTHESDAFRAYRLGAVDYLLSPIVPDILRAKAAVFIRLHRLRHEAQAQRIAMEGAYRELRSAYTEMEHFSYSVSHDLRTPLGHIAGFVELLRLNSSDVLDQKSRQYLLQVIEATKRMNGLIDDMLELSRMTRSALRAEPVDLSALAREVAAEISEAQPQRRMNWKLADDVQVHGDAGLLRAAVSNLLGNAWKYSVQTDSPQIEFGRLDSDGQAIYFVGDNGTGFDVKAAGDRLFRPFQRFHSGTAFEGTGVGLAIVQRVVVKHGGSIWAESAPGQGARFFFTLPGADTPAVSRLGALS